MKKICIIGATISGNKGAESMVHSAVENIGNEIPDAFFYLFTYYPKQDRKKNKNLNLKICSGTPLKLAIVYPSFSVICLLLPFFKSHFKKIDNDFFILLESDLIIDMGGVSFVDGREKYLAFNIACILVPILFRKRIIKYSQALGPFNNPINRFFAKMLLPKINHIIARGKITYCNLKSIGLKNTLIGADAAFTLKISNSSYKIASNYIDDNFQKKMIIGIAPSSVIEESCEDIGIDYTSIISNFINYLIEDENYHVIIIPHSIRKYTTKRKNNDLLVSRKIHEKVSSKKCCILIADDLSAEVLRVLISHCNYFIASRFHAMVSSLSMSVPTIVCGWSHKYLEVLQMFEMEDYAFDYTKLDTMMLINMFKKLKEDHQKIKEKFEKFLPNVDNSARINCEIAKSLLMT
ncbi:MAG: colanic acid biosynthesis protein [Methanoregulaceae archaeon PtaU1.Bin066]|jgi:polysaccharide pyruvyl transferase WcaK-like protein|nr:MAG: colanic acid biosynthesis protein [Methanoregulaceae archaeon PtaU1.Bin066]